MSTGPLAALWRGLCGAALESWIAGGLRLPGDPAEWAAGPAAARLRAEAAAEAADPWPPAPAHAWARFRLDGGRVEYEDAQFARARRLTRAVVAALAESSESSLAAVLDGVILLCEQSSWCWPAHDDAFDARGDVLPDVARPVVDLGAGEILAQLAWVDAVLGAALETRYPGVRYRLRREATWRVFDPFLRRHDWDWATRRPDNWTPWICGNILIGALQLADDPAMRARLVRACIRGLDRYLATLPADGACEEGTAYWWQGPCRALESAVLLRDATGLDALGLPALRAAVSYPGRMHLGGGWYANYGDACAHPGGEQPWQALFALARAVGDREAEAFAVASSAGSPPSADDGLGRVLRALSDLAWTERPTDTPAPLAREAFLPSTGEFLARERPADPTGLVVCAKVGAGGVGHAHADVGSVIVALDGRPLIVDAGRMTYTADTFGPRRFEAWPMRSAWHNVPLVDGTEQGVGQPAGDVICSPADPVSALTADIGPAYPGSPRLHRTVTLDRTRAVVTVADTWDEATQVEERFLLAGEVVPDGPGRVVVRAGRGDGLLLAWSSAAAYELVSRPLDDRLLADVWGPELTQLRIRPGAAGEFVLTVRRHEHRTSVRRDRPNGRRRRGA